MSQVSVNQILDESAALLNDPTQKMFTDVLLLPLIKRAFNELQLHLQHEQVQVLGENSTSFTISVGTTTWAGPSDLVQPLRMEEKGATDTVYTPMYEKQWEPSIGPTSTLRYWTWREQALCFIGATEERLVQLYYLKALGAISDINSIIAVNNCQPYLAALTAAYAAAFIGENPTKAAILKDAADESLELMLSTEANRRQSMPVRRIPASRSLNRGLIK